MPLYEYTARNASTGQIMKGQLDVPTREDVIKHIKQNKMSMVNVREAPKQISFSLGKKGIKTRDVVIFTRQFATMIDAGLPLVQSLDILAKQTENPSLATVTRGRSQLWRGTPVGRPRGRTGTGMDLID